MMLVLDIINYSTPVPLEACVGLVPAGGVGGAAASRVGTAILVVAHAAAAVHVLVDWSEGA